ncbi:MAG: hypothetical protein ACXWBO_00740 [Ilumatobacteraceae bacterium]
MADELGVYDDLLALFTEPGPFLEWGIVEHLYAQRNPATYRELVDRYSHTAYGPTQYSASAFLGRAAGQLASDGHLMVRFENATGYWSYNGVISAFALPPGPDDAAITTWADFAIHEGFAPDDWPALGYRADQGTIPKLIVDEPWSDALARRWILDETRLSAGALCAWNHSAENPMAATRIVVIEHRGVQDARGCCDECRASVFRYVGESAG